MLSHKDARTANQFLGLGPWDLHSQLLPKLPALITGKLKQSSPKTLAWIYVKGWQVATWNCSDKRPSTFICQDRLISYIFYGKSCPSYLINRRQHYLRNWFFHNSTVPQQGSLKHGGLNGGRKIVTVTRSPQQDGLHCSLLIRQKFWASGR